MLGQSKCLRGILLTKRGMRIRLIYQAIADKDPWLNAAHGQCFCNGQWRDATGLAPGCCRHIQLPRSAENPCSFTPVRALARSPLRLLCITINNAFSSAEGSLCQE